VAFLPGIKHGICHRCTSTDQLMPGCIAGEPRDGEVGPSCRLHLMLSSPLGQALSQGSPGDELTYQAGEKERGVLFVSLETVSAQAA
ncbi:hypothetical protein, partial [Bradyrhizobium japonicum]|uniref:hypothetical protein n=1 Tax=Bradyrhizobium japonicum TaxID=375 RepID=UPI001AEF6E56